MPEGRINKMTHLQDTKFLRLFGLTNVHYQCSYAQICLTLCIASSALCFSDMTYIPQLYVFRSNTSDCANILTHPFGMTFFDLIEWLI
jgi:hypothetical protein